MLQVTVDVPPEIARGAAPGMLVLAADGTVDLDAIDLSVGAPGALDCAPRFTPEAELPEDEAEPQGCGCGSVMPSVTWGWVVLGVVGLRRRTSKRVHVPRK